MNCSATQTSSLGCSLPDWITNFLLIAARIDAAMKFATTRGLLGSSINLDRRESGLLGQVQGIKGVYRNRGELPPNDKTPGIIFLDGAIERKTPVDGFNLTAMPPAVFTLKPEVVLALTPRDNVNNDTLNGASNPVGEEMSLFEQRIVGVVLNDETLVAMVGDDGSVVYDGLESDMRDFYGSIRSTFGFNEIFNTKAFTVGPLRNLSLEVGVDAGVENNPLSPAKRAGVLGLLSAFDLSYKGFFNVVPLRLPLDPQGSELHRRANVRQASTATFNASARISSTSRSFSRTNSGAVLIL